ncbi:MAG: DUF2066 domain-containing protein [Candidatus Sedimenticola endophacoides]
MPLFFQAPRIFRILPWLLLPLFSAPVLAVKVSGLYQSEVPVVGQEAEQRNEAIIQALSLVLTKVSGSRSIANRPELAGALAQAPRYVQQYRYRLDDSRESASEAQPQRYLEVAFDPRAVDNLLRQHRLPVWGDNRPGGLVWLGEQGRGGRRLLGSEDNAWTLLAESARARGLALITPLMDLEDQARLQVADLWGDFESNIRQASLRYGSDCILTGRLEAVSATLWRSSWRLYQGEQVAAWNNDGGGREELLRQGVAYAADLLASRYAPVASDSGLSRLRLRVAGISDFRDFTAVERFLVSQSGVERVDLDAAEAEAATFLLQVRGAQSVEQGLGLGGLLSPDEAVAEGGPLADLYYRLR